MKYKLIAYAADFVSFLLERLGETDIVINQIILFGSVSRAEAQKDSDVDIYSSGSNVFIKKKIEAIDSSISARVGSFDRDSILIKEIVENHVIIKGVEEYYEKSRFFG